MVVEALCTGMARRFTQFSPQWKSKWRKHNKLCQLKPTDEFGDRSIQHCFGCTRYSFGVGQRYTDTSSSTLGGGGGSGDLQCLIIKLVFYGVRREPIQSHKSRICTIFINSRLIYRGRNMSYTWCLSPPFLSLLYQSATTIAATPCPSATSLTNGRWNCNYKAASCF